MRPVLWMVGGTALSWLISLAVVLVPAALVPLIVAFAVLHLAGIVVLMIRTRRYLG